MITYTFLDTLNLLQTPNIFDYRYPKNVTYLQQYQKKENIINQDDISENYLVYIENDTQKYIGIDKEIKLIQLLNYTLTIPQSRIKLLEKMIYRAIEFLDTCYKEKNNEFQCFYLSTDIKTLYTIYFQNNNNLFNNNPIKKDLYLAKLHYIIKKYIDYHMVCPLPPFVDISHDKYLNIFIKQLQIYYEKNSL